MGFEPHRWKGEAKALLGRFFGLTRLVLLVPFINTSTTRGTPANQLNTSNKEAQSEGWRRGELRGLLRSFVMANVSSSLLEGVEVI